MIEHSNLFNYLISNKNKYNNGDESYSGSFIHMSYTFDASITGIFMPLLCGKSIVIGSKQSVEIFEDRNLQKYAPYDFIKITPSHLELLQNRMKMPNGGLLTKKLIIGGEALFLSQLKNFIEERLDAEIINEYGPTEATVGCSIYSFNISDVTEKTENELPIGKPIDNVQLYILGEKDELLPIGMSGEICIAGAGLSGGYLNLPELTAEKFVPRPVR